MCVGDIVECIGGPLVNSLKGYHECIGTCMGACMGAAWSTLLVLQRGRKPTIPRLETKCSKARAGFIQMVYCIIKLFIITNLCLTTHMKGTLRTMYFLDEKSTTDE